MVGFYRQLVYPQNSGFSAPVCFMFHKSTASVHGFCGKTVTRAYIGGDRGGGGGSGGIAPPPKFECWYCINVCF